MIPSKLTLKGIYSYSETQTIDFNKLTDSSLFGIFGSVGSGKSTILEAISFALYGETERLNKKDSRNYNMMNLKSNELLIDFEFYTTTKNHLYRFVVKGKRNKKNFNDVKSFDRSCFILSDALETKDNDQASSWLPCEQTAEDIIGLNYNNFKRTIIIPQGKFKEFLELRPTERTDMLKDIFNLQRFDLAAKLKRIYFENKTRLDILLGKMEQYQDLNNEVLSNKKIEQKQLLIIEKDQQKELNHLTEEHTALSQLKQLFDQFNQSQSDLQKLKNSTKLFEKRKRDLADYSYCKQEFTQLLKSESDLQKEIQQYSLQKQNIEKQLITHQTTKIQLDKDLSQVKLNYDKKDRLLDEAQELQLIISIRKNISENNILIERVKKGDKIIFQQKLDIDQQQLLRQKEKNKQLKLKDNMADLSLLNAIKHYLLKEIDLNSDLKKITTERDHLLKDIETLHLIQKSQLSEDLYASDSQIVKEKINAQLEQLENSKKQVNNQLNHFLAQEKLKQWADNLENGEACPVCGSQDHPQILNMQDLVKEITTHQDQKISLGKQIKVLEVLFNTIEKNEIERLNLTKLVDKNSAEEKQKKNEISQHQYHLPLQSYSDETREKYKQVKLDAIEQLIKESQSVALQVKQSELDINNFELEIQRLQKLFEKYVNVHHQLKEEHIALDATIKNELLGLKLFSMKQLENEADDVLLVMVKSKKEVVSAAIEDFNQLTLNLNKIQSEWDKISGQEHTIKNLLCEKHALILNVSSSVDKKLLESKFKQRDDITKLLKRNINEHEENKLIADYEAQLKLTTATFNKLQQELQQNTEQKLFDQNNFNKLNKSIIEKQNQLKSLLYAITIIENDIKKISLDLQQKKNLDKQYKMLEKRKDNINVLTKLFKAQGFVNYISSVYLQNLSEAANERFFKMTKQQLKLEINENNEFQVRDYLNEGKTRSVKTLSGGQIFQASLALALALADSVQKQIKAEHNFFFLDEGFGSLDDESLHIVFSALKSLKDENRIVGVISHVESIKQEIDVHIQVNKDEQHGSLVQYSWS